MSLSNKEIVEKVNEAFSKDDIEGFLNYCVDDVKWNMAGSPTLIGKDAIRESMEKMEFVGPPEIGIDKVIGEGDTVVVEGTLDMTKKSGEPYHATYCDIYQIENEKIQELHSYVQEFAPVA